MLLVYAYGIGLLNPPPLIDRILERYLEFSAFGATSIFSPLSSMKPKEPDKIEPPDKKSKGRRSRYVKGIQASPKDYLVRSLP